MVTVALARNKQLETIQTSIHSRVVERGVFPRQSTTERQTWANHGCIEWVLRTTLGAKAKNTYEDAKCLEI